MALSKDQKTDIIKDISELFNSSKLTVVAKYEGTGVKAMQGLRRDAKVNATKIKVVKNRLVKKALESNNELKSVDTSALEGMLLYAFNSQDEVAPAQVLNNFAKTNPNLEFVGAITAEGEFIGNDEVKALAVLPGKPQMLAGILNTLNSPVRGVVSSLSGNLSGLLQGLEAKAN